MGVTEVLATWYFAKEGPGKDLFIDAVQNVDGTWDFYLELFQGDEETRKETLTGMEGALDYSQSDIDVMRKIHDICKEYSGVSDFDLWTQMTYPGYDIWQMAETEPQRQGVRDFYAWIKEVYEKMQAFLNIKIQVLNTETNQLEESTIFESFLALDI